MRASQSQSHGDVGVDAEWFSTTGEPEEARLRHHRLQPLDRAQQHPLQQSDHRLRPELSEDASRLECYARADGYEAQQFNQ